jgi:hypothetical protein
MTVAESERGDTPFPVGDQTPKPEKRIFQVSDHATYRALQVNTALQTFFDGPALIVFHNAGLVRAECGHSRDQWTSRKLILSARSFCLFCGTVDFKRIPVPSTVLDEFGC